MIILDTSSLVQMTTVEDDHDDAARFRGLLESAKRSGTAVGIPAPAFAEFLVRTDDATTEMLAMFEKKQSVRILPFDKRAAHECALLDRAALLDGDKRAGAKGAWQKVKIDRQIIAIARVHVVRRIITSDASLKSLAARLGIEACSVSELPIPDEAKQRNLELPGAD